MRIGMLGCGHLGKSLALVWQSLPQVEIVACVKSIQSAEALQAAGIVASTEYTLLRDVDVLCVAVRPKDVAVALHKVRPLVRQDTLIVSLAAGIYLDALQGIQPCARLMPNLACGFGQGIVGVYAQTLPSQAAQYLHTLVECLGVVVRVDAEQALEVITVVGGAAPALVLVLVQATLEMAADQGLSEQQAQETVIGLLQSVAVLLQQNNDPQYWIKGIAVPGGVTEQGILSLHNNKINKLWQEALYAILARCRNVGK